MGVCNEAPRAVTEFDFSMMSMAPPFAIPSTPAERHWLARLQLEFVANGRTKLARMRHEGPLVVQRPFYPEDDVCHVYLLHPPGGIAPGDHVQLDAKLRAGSQVVMTTPSAGKVYATDTANTGQQQVIHMVLE